MAARSLTWRRAAVIAGRDLRSAPGKFVFVVLSVAVGVAAGAAVVVVVVAQPERAAQPHPGN